MKTFRTVRDVLIEKQDAEAAQIERENARRAKVPQFVNPTDPRIGILNRQGVPVYYAYINEHYTEGTLEQIEQRLGV